MTITKTANKLRDILAQWAEPNGGTAQVVFDLREMWATAYKESEKPRILICYNGEQIRGDFSVAALLGRVDRQWLVAITRGRGFNPKRGQSLTDSKGNAEPFYDSVENVRDYLRCAIGVSAENLRTDNPDSGTIDFKAIRPMDNGDLIVDGYIIEFSTAADLPLVATTPEEAAQN